MASYYDLDVDSVAKIGLMFLNGDALEDVVRDKYNDFLNYMFDNFNECRKVVLKIERMNPNLGLCAILWQKRADNSGQVMPVVVGKSLPLEGWQTGAISPALQQAYDGAFGVVCDRGNGMVSHYYPALNSDCDIVGVLELLEGLETRVDI